MLVWKLFLFLAANWHLAEAILAAGGAERGARARVASGHLRVAVSAAVSRPARNWTAVLTALRHPEDTEDDHAAAHQAWQGPEGEEYDVREKRIEEKCEGLEKCRDLCAWIKRDLMKKYGSLDKAYEAADTDGDGHVADFEFTDQCVAAGVADEAISARGYIFIYVADVNLDGDVSRKAYERIFRIAEVADTKETPSELDSEKKHEIEDSDGWGEVKMKDDFEPTSSTTKRTTTESTTTTTEAEEKEEEEKETSAPKEEKGKKDKSSWWNLESWESKERSGATWPRQGWTVVVAAALPSCLLLLRL